MNEKPSYEQLEAELKALKIKHADVTDQLEELRRGRIVTEGEQQDIARIRAEHLRMNNEQNKLALWLRDNKAEEIRRGEHKGLSVSDVCIKYMRASLKPGGWLRRKTTRNEN